MNQFSFEMFKFFISSNKFELGFNVHVLILNLNFMLTLKLKMHTKVL